jgi:ATP-dependent HslUV protease subunit HslV
MVLINSLMQAFSARLLRPRYFPSAAFSNKFTHREHDFHSTTMLSVRKGKQVALIADGQISLGPTVFKNTAKKLRKIHDNVVCGFAGSAADCLALMELLEKEFEKYPG